MVKPKLKKYNFINILYVVLGAIFFFFVVYLNLSVKSEQQFVYLAQSLLQGKTYFVEMPPNTGDMVPFNGKYYWSNPPFPAILLMPFVYFADLYDTFFYQGFLQIILVIGTYYLIFKIAKHFKYETNNALILAFAFCFSSVYLGVAMWPWSWFFAQVVATALIFLAFWEFIGRRRYLLIGLYFGLIFMTRTTATVGIVFYFLYIFLNDKSFIKEKFIKLLTLVLPVFSGAILLGFYNYLRFRNIYEFGYTISLLPQFHFRAREYGVFNLIHVPGNLYNLFLGSPIPVFKDEISHVLKFPFVVNNPWGMGIFVTSPYLLYLFFIKYKDKLSRLMLATSLLIFIPISLFYGIGFRQFGFRYSLDFLPYLFLVFMIGYKTFNNELSVFMKILIILSACLNLHLFLFGFLK